MSMLDNKGAANLMDCSGQLDSIEAGLLSLEDSGTEVDNDLIDNVFQSVQSVRAAASTCDLATMSELAQHAEDVIQLIRSRKMAPTPARVGVLLTATDRLREMLHHAGSSNQADSAEVLAALAKLIHATQVIPAAPVVAPSSVIAPEDTGWHLRVLIVEDDFASRLVLQSFLARYGECHVAVNGREAVDAVRASLDRGQKYDLICMDIMMPEMDGHEAVRLIRALEESRGILWSDGAKIIMTTAVDNIKEVFRCFLELCDAYLVKPIDLSALLVKMKAFQLIR